MTELFCMAGLLEKFFRKPVEAPIPALMCVASGNRYFSFFFAFFVFFCG
jgi:hypothetical protein